MSENIKSKTDYDLKDCKLLNVIPDMKNNKQNSEEYSEINFEIRDNVIYLRNGKTELEPLDGKYDYIFDEYGKLHLGHGHYFLAKEKPVILAGQCELNNGRMTKTDNCSGHYRPTEKIFNKYLAKCLKYNKIDADEVEKESFPFPKNYNERNNKNEQV